jgi:hypothetical protein
MSDISRDASMEQHRASQEGLGIGKLIEGEQHRDAIHVAIVPVVAGEPLYAGLHVGLVEGKAFPSQFNRVGIVDPFLTDAVQKGDRFWLFLYPGSITSLRHVWTHPALPAEEGTPAAHPTFEKSASEKWMRAWATKHMGEDYYGEYGTPLSEDTAYDNAIKAGDTTHLGPYEEARDHIDDEWWKHWEAITGRSGKPGSYFSCAC